MSQTTYEFATKCKNTNNQLRIILHYFANLIKIKEELYGDKVQRESENKHMFRCTSGIVQICKISPEFSPNPSSSNVV